MTTEIPDPGRTGAGEQPALKQYWATLRSHPWVILACIIVGLIGAGAYIELTPKTYTAQAEMLENAAPSTDTALSSLPVLHASGDPAEDALTAASLITTTPVAEAVIAKLHLHSTPVAVLGHISAAPIGQSELVAIQANASSPALAQELANGFMYETIAVGTRQMHAAIAQILPSIRAQVAAIPLAERYGPGSLGQELGELENLQNSADPTLSVAAPASLPTGPSSPDKKLALIAGLLGGILLGIGAAFAYSAVDPRLRGEEQLRATLPQSPLLARIPPVRARRRSGPLIPAELGPAAHEGYRTLRSALSASARGRPQAVLLTGSAPSEGKTTSAITLAYVLAQGGSRVVLIEADLRRPQLASALHLAVHHGTEDVLIAAAQLREALVPVWVEDRPVRVLAARSAGVELADRLAYEAVRKLIAEARELADFVIIDSPPLTAVADALALAQIADRVIVVSRLGHTRLNALEKLAALLREHSVAPPGLVLVGAEERAASSYYYASYQHAPSANGAGAIELAPPPVPSDRS
jgi:capsular exopolysaccharide synthesis family protein